MISRVTQEIADLYTRRHETRGDIFGDKPYANYGCWVREGMRIEEACDAMTDAVARAARMGPGDRVLEVGCGYGASAAYTLRTFGPEVVVGIDVTDVRVEGARAFAEQNGLADRARFQVGDATKLDFPAGAFTRVIAIECAMHFDTRRDFFREAARVLVPGGWLGMTDIIPRRGTDLTAYRAKVHFPIGSNGSLDVTENVYDADVYEAILGEEGFQEIRIESITDRTVPCFANHLERVARRTDGERGQLRLLAAQMYREYVEAGVDYVLVSARRAAK